MDFTKVEVTPPWGCITTVLLCLNLAIIAAQLPISALNCWLLVRSSLHPNLRAILIAQSICFCALSMERCVHIGLIFVLGPSSYLNVPILQFFLICTIQFMNFIGHILLIERLLATFMVNNYEQFRKPLFTIAWASILILVCVWNSFQQIFLQSSDGLNSTLHFTTGFMAATFAWTGLALAEIIVIFLVGTYNLHAFKQDLRQRGIHQLSKRYQMAENIRTARQLGPSFTCHFVNIATTAPFPISIYFGLVQNPTIIFFNSILCFIAMSLCMAINDFCIMSRHPILRRNAIEFLSELFIKLRLRNRNRIKPTVSSLTPKPEVNQMDVHFEVLHQEWKHENEK